MIKRLKLNRRGVAALLKSDTVAADLDARARRVAGTAGPGFVAETRTGRTRARSIIYPDTFDAALTEHRDQALTRAIDAAR